tara:strand:+ start:88 stop:519 length:432 start_codon:yes stop_codon:yes gene_type:complete
MKFGPIKGGGNGNNQPHVRGEVYSIDLYCSTRSTNNLTQMFGEINDMNVLVIASSIIGSTQQSSTSMPSNTKIPNNVSISGDLSCLHCKGNNLYAYCDRCSKWYCSATHESLGKEDYHTCPIHGRAQIIGTKEIDPDSQGKKK